eukprot:s43_g21.t1
MFAMRSQLNGVERLPLPLHFYCFAVATQVSQTLRQAVLGHLRVRVSSSQRLLAGSEHFSVDLQGFGLATECT